MSEHYYPAECSFFPSEKDDLIMRNRNTGDIKGIRRLEAELFTGLSGCSDRETFLRQLELINRHRLSSSVLTSAIERWIDADMLRPCRLLSGAEEQENTLSGDRQLISAVFTGRRPESLGRWLSSRTASPHFSGRKLTILVCDDSRDIKGREQNRRITEAAAVKYPGVLLYLGSEAREETRKCLVQEAAAKGIDTGLVDFALYGPGERGDLIAPGANRNMALLMSGGKDLLLSDDDLYYRFYAFVNPVEGGERFSREIHSPVQFFPSMKALEEETVSIQDYDLPGKVMEYLGAPLNPAWNTEELWPATARSMETGGATVGAVTAGYAGGRWYGFAQFPAMRRYLSDDDFYLDKERYEQVIANGINIIAPEAVSIYEGDFLQAGTLALSGSLTIPPFFPVDRHEDPAFGTLLKFCNDRSCFCHLPAALLHDPSCKKPFGRDTEPFFVGPGRANQLISREIGVSLYGDTGDGRLEEAGRKYRERAALSQPSFEEYCASLIGDYCREMINHIERQLEIYSGEPEWWAADLRGFRGELKNVEQSPLENIPEEFRLWTGQYGRLIEVWPVLMDVYRDKGKDIFPQ